MRTRAHSYELGADIGRYGRAAWTFTGRSGGVSTGPFASLNLADHVGDDATAVSENRTRVARTMNAEAVAIMRAAHGRDVAVVDSGGEYDGVDVLVTTQPGVALMALAADCATVVLADPVADVIAAVHSGWRGVAANTVGAAVSAMSDAGARPARVRAAIGPTICHGCYEVSEQVQARVAQSAPLAAAVTRRGSPAVDVRAGIRQQLRSAGVVEVTDDPTCTAESPDLYSYRRDGLTGRHGAAIVMAARDRD